MSRLRAPSGSCWIAAALVALCSGCGQGKKGEADSPAPADSAVARPQEQAEPSPAAAATSSDTPAVASSPQAAPDAAVSHDVVGVCAVERIDPDRLALTVAWKGEHLQVTGHIREGTGKTLNLVLTRRAKFVYDEVFKGDRLGSFTLASDSLEATSVAYTPTPAEQGAFDRRGSLKLDLSERLCLDASLYDKLNLLAIRHIEVPPRGTGRVE
ncbi:MAG TPA: hypothetical protein VIC59_11360 [Gemmatimonadota bacterium]|jgi:hypothetical protein